MAKYRFRQDPATRYTISGKTYYVTVGEMEFQIESTTSRNSQGGKRFYCGMVPGNTDTIVMGFGRAEIEAEMEAKAGIA